MWALIAACILVSASAVDSETFRKCCPNGQSLIKVTNSDGNTQYSCLDSALKSTLNVNNLSNSVIFVSDSAFVEYGIPKDCDLEMIHFDKSIIYSGRDDNACYEQLVLELVNGTAKTIIPKTVGLVCNGTSITIGSDVKIQNIKKCCPSGQWYDTKNSQCRSADEANENNFDYQWFIKLLKAPGDVFEFNDGLFCKSVEYDVRIDEDAFQLTLNGNILNIHKRADGTTFTSSAGNWCVDREYTTRKLTARVCTQECESFGAFCIKKCCPIGQHYQPIHCGTTRSACVPTIDDATLFDLGEYVSPINREYGTGEILGMSMQLTCPYGKVVLNKSEAHDVHRLTSDGKLSSNMGVSSEYCLELFDWRACGHPPQITAVVCYQAVVPQVKNFKVSFVLICISCVCLALTLLVYCSIPELRNLHGRNVICHVSMMLLAFSCLARVQYRYVADKNVCAALGYGIYFGFVAAFVWLNVMCVDIWWTFGSVRTVQPLHKGRATRRRFLWYSLYAWGVAVTITVAVYLLDRFPVATVLDANMGYYSCWFGTVQNSTEDWPHYIFFVIPMGVVTTINFVLWLLTARHCARVKSEVHRLQAGSVGDRAKWRFRVDKANFVLTGKLWVVMGAGWGTELISTLMDPVSTGWFVTIVDTINELQGVFIFVILVFKPKLYYLIRKRLGLEKPDAQKNGQSSTARTSSTFFSRTISSDERANARVSVPNDNAKLS